MIWKENVECRVSSGINKSHIKGNLCYLILPLVFEDKSLFYKIYINGT